MKGLNKSKSGRKLINMSLSASSKSLLTLSTSKKKLNLVSNQPIEKPLSRGSQIKKIKLYCINGRS